MLVLEANKIKKQYGERLLFQFEQLKIYSRDRIGIVGLNGSGKTTLMKVLAGEDRPDEGSITRYGQCAYLDQVGDGGHEPVAQAVAGKFGVYPNEVNRETLSGGEQTRLKISRALSSRAHILFLDEPTSNLDMPGFKLLTEELQDFQGALVIISHDRMLLDALCTTMIEIENGKVNVYPGNYTDYKEQKATQLTRQQFEYEQYVKEKKRLLNAKLAKEQKAKAMRKTPARMGNSEARLHKRGVNGKRAKVEKAAKAMETRLEQLEKKEKPAKLAKTQIDFQEAALYCQIAIQGKHVSKSFGNVRIIEQISFAVPTGSKVALIGDNGSGKTALIRMIVAGEEGIEVAKGVKIGYFRQDLMNLNPERSVLDNVLAGSSMEPKLARIILARLLFKRDDVYKYVGILSGGELVKAALAKIIVSDANVLVLDEPTNYLDLYSLEALEQVLKDYSGTVLFVSHDRRFVDEVADHVMILENGGCTQFTGNYTEYLAYTRGRAAVADEARENRILQLENRLNAIVGQLSLLPKNAKHDNRAELDKEYYAVMKELKEFKKEEK